MALLPYQHHYCNGTDGVVHGPWCLPATKVVWEALTPQEEVGRSCVVTDRWGNEEREAGAPRSLQFCKKLAVIAP